ncbi:ABC transporter substrate-binding protein [Stappia sp. ES.058]|uniref:ABC transporter substrate-binding protein n=1 Tax=Stappia sp. ES.058 TaxID=1881061 RepID=UPI00087B168D|nr:ABC transporter substrate-binding protein [Stappia sp. ES.058]SDU00416.1 peptide/nickel transport system substrate-binding protein [Stappia sp. ES.058]
MMVFFNRRTVLAASLMIGAATAFGPAPAQAARTDLVLGVRLEPPHLDPTAGAAAAIDEVTYANIFEGLTRIDRNGAVQPWLARSWEISEDGLAYTFSLQEGVTFHDGTAFDAEDVKFSLDRARAEDSTNAQKPLFAGIESIEVVDPATVRITLAKPNGGFLFNLGWGDAAMVAPESAETNKTKPVGTGPFRFSNWAQGDNVEIVRNDAYWGDPVALEKATFKIIADPGAALASLLAGDVDAFPIFLAPENLPMLEVDPRFTVAVGTTEGETILAMNNKAGPLADVRVRRAISHAIDRQAIIDGAMFGIGTPIGTHFAPHHPAYVDLTDTYPLDLDKAKALLAEAGYPDGFTATIKLPPPVYARRGGELIASDLKKIGVELEIVPLEWAQWLSEVFKGKDFDFTIVSHTEPMDIGIYGRKDYYFQYDSPRFDETMAKLEIASDTNERYALMGEAQRIITEDAVNAYLFQLAKAGVWASGLKGLWVNAPIQANDLTGVSWQ